MAITSLSQFVGNHHTLEAVQTMLTQGRVPQALIIEGPKGSGRTTLARLIAAGLLCGQALPCGQCNSCRKVLVTGHPDVFLVVPEKDKAHIVVEQIRKVRGEAFLRPVEGGCKVFILGGSMNDAAQNTLLKVLEEPPAGVYFILLCHHRKELLETVLSRGSVCSLGPVSFEEALPFFQHQGWEVTPALEQELSQKGGLLGLVAGRDDTLLLASTLAQELAMALGSRSRSAFLIAGAKAAENRLLYAPVLGELYQILHYALLTTQGVNKPHPYGESVELLARRLPPQTLLQQASLVQQEQTKIQYNVNGSLFFTALCSGLLPRS